MTNGTFEDAGEIRIFRITNGTRYFIHFNIRLPKQLSGYFDAMLRYVFHECLTHLFLKDTT
ncbi:hypothetical protein D3C71_1926710 [compost metagenome]